MGTVAALQALMFNAAVMSAAMVLLGAVVVFILLYMILERKKKSLIAVFMVVLLGFGAFYWSMGRKHMVSPLDVPKSVVTETIRKTPDVVPLPKPRPHKKRKPAPVFIPQKQTQALDICPPHLFN